MPQNFLKQSQLLVQVTQNQTSRSITTNQWQEQKKQYLDGTE